MDKTIIGKLKGVQVRERLTDKEMGKRLGCSRQTYQATRSGNSPLGNKMLKGIPRAFPELQDDISIFLFPDANNLLDNAKTQLKQPSEAQGGRVKKFCGRLLGVIKNLFPKR